MGEAVSAAEANRDFSKLLRRVRDGGSFVITNRGTPVAKLIPVDGDTAVRNAAKRVLLDWLRAQRGTRIGNLDARRVVRRPVTRIPRLTPTSSRSHAEDTNGAARKHAALDILKQAPLRIDADSGPGSGRAVQRPRQKGAHIPTQRRAGRPVVGRCVSPID